MIKMCGKSLIFVCLTYICLVDSTSATFVSNCSWTDRKCIKEVSQKTIKVFADGIPDLNVERLDPLKLGDIDASTSYLKLTLKDAELTGIKKCKVRKMQLYLTKAKINIQFECAKWEIIGKYDMQGRLLFMPIEGSGDIHITLGKLTMDAKVYFEDKVGKADKKHWHIKNHDVNYELIKSVFKFENLCPDNQCLRNATEYAIANNGKVVFDEIGPTIVETAVNQVSKIIQSFLTEVPLEEIGSIVKYFQP